MGVTRSRWALAALVLGAMTAHAQSGAGVIRGVARDAASRDPIPFAIIRLVAAPDSSGRPMLAALTAVDGAFSFSNIAPGSYRLRIDRIGFEAFATPVFRLAPGDSLRQDVSAKSTAVHLAAMRILPSRCLTLDQLHEDAQIATLWNEAQKGILTLRTFEETYRYRIDLTQHVKFDRRLAFDVTRDYTTTRVNDPDSAATVWKTAAARNRDSGYVQTGSGNLRLTLPHGTELFGDEFLRDHCLETNAQVVDGLHALRFRPSRPRAAGYDIRGTVWLEETFLIRRLDLEYVKGDTVFMQATARYADTPIENGTVRLVADGEASGKPPELAMINGMHGTFRFTYSLFERRR